MTVRAEMFTPEVLLSAPRRSAGVPNATGSLVLYTTSTYSFQDHKKTAELRCLDIKTAESTLLTSEDGVSEPVWLEDDTFLCFKSGKQGSTDIIVGSVGKRASWDQAYVAGNIDASASSLKVTKLSGGNFAIVLAAPAYPDGSLFNAEKATKTHSTGRLYKTLFVRHWDEYVGKEKNALWYSTLTQGKEGRYELGSLVNALKGTGLESPVPPFGGTDSFDLSKSGIIFVSKDPDLNPGLNVKCNAYYIELSTFVESKAPKPTKYALRNYEGASTSPVFSPDGKQAAFLSMKAAGYEADQNKIFLIPNVKGATVTSLSIAVEGQAWDRSPQSLAFSHDGTSLYFPAEDEGYGCLFALDLEPAPATKLTKLSKHGYVSDVKPLASGQVFVSASSLVDTSFFSILDPTAKEEKIETWNNSMTKFGSSIGLCKGQVSSIRFPASDPSVNPEVHAWVLKPSSFDATRGTKYPLALLIHGGPQGSWGDSWSTRWNPAVFAEQGYIVVSPNVTGSTGYGQAFTNNIRKDWGGAPYQDLVNCFEHIEKNMPEVDTSRAVALGASYGGYMVNWLNGHDLGRKFKALVCHDGIFSMEGLLATEELYFPFYDLGGTPWKSGPKNNTKDKALADAAVLAQDTFGKSSIDAWKKNDPSRFLDQWATPQLVIHNSKDYRLCISEGLAAFNVLQARGVESQFLTFPDENHFVLKPENSLVWHKTVINWINDHVGLPKLSENDEDDEFFGGVKTEDTGPVDMMTMGKPET